MRCIGPSHIPGVLCNRPARVCNPCSLCATHYQQQRRGRALRPIGGDGPRVRLPGMLVSPECAAALEKNGPTVYEAARAVLERWATRTGVSSIQSRKAK
jgi:hypothetical protein